MMQVLETVISCYKQNYMTSYDKAMAHDFESFSISGQEREHKLILDAKSKDEDLPNT